MARIIEIENLSISVNHRRLMQNVSFCVNGGDAVLLSGANGTGKSTLLRSILRLETDEQETEGRIYHEAFGDIGALDRSELQRYRSQIAYVPQRDEYAEMGNVQVRDIISESKESHANRTLSVSEVNDLIDEWVPRRNDGTRIFDAKSKAARLSGGEQRLLSVLSAISTRPAVDLMIIDEPLNNLDFSNVKNISNMINRARVSNPEMGILMVSHCRIFPFINREIRLMPDGAFEADGSYVCHGCFGIPDAGGFYPE